MKKLIIISIIVLGVNFNANIAGAQENKNPSLEIYKQIKDLPKEELFDRVVEFEEMLGSEIYILKQSEKESNYDQLERQKRYIKIAKGVALGVTAVSAVFLALEVNASSPTWKFFSTSMKIRLNPLSCGQRITIVNFLGDEFTINGRGSAISFWASVLSLAGLELIDHYVLNPKYVMAKDARDKIFKSALEYYGQLNKTLSFYCRKYKSENYDSCTKHKEIMKDLTSELF